MCLKIGCEIKCSKRCNEQVLNNENMNERKLSMWIRQNSTPLFRLFLASVTTPPTPWGSRGKPYNVGGGQFPDETTTEPFSADLHVTSFGGVIGGGVSDCSRDMTDVFLRTDSDSQVGSSPFSKSSEKSSLTRGSKTSSDRFGPYKTTLFQTPMGILTRDNYAR